MTADWTFELDGVPFGAGQRVQVQSFERAAAETRDQDQPSGFGDWVLFGTDRKTPGLWSWELDTAGAGGTTDMLDAVQQLEQAWDADGVRHVPGQTLPLSYGLGGRSRRVYGRPRRFASTPWGVAARQGIARIIADFQPAHIGSFDDTALSSPTITLGASALGGTGVTFPLTFPTLWGGTVASPRFATITVGGMRATPLTLALTAGVEPVIDPYVIVAGRTLQLEGTLTPGDTVLVRGTPWDAGVFRADGTPAALTLTAGSRLADLTVPPGQVGISFGGIDGSGTAVCVVSWRNAYPSI